MSLYIGIKKEKHYETNPGIDNRQKYTAYSFRLSGAIQRIGSGAGFNSIQGKATRIYLQNKGFYIQILYY